MPLGGQFSVGDNMLGLIAVMRREALEVEFKQFVHCRGTALSPEARCTTLVEAHRIVAVSLMINALPVLVLALRLLRKIDPDKIVVVGGAGMVGIGAEVLRCTPEIDVVAFREGESTVGPLFRALIAGRSLRAVPGIHYRQQGALLSARPAPRSEDLDRLPLPDYAGIDFSKYHSVGLMASRGCPFGCTFCDVAPAWGRRNTQRSVDHVLDEMQELFEEHGISDIGFADDLFIVDLKWVEAFCTRKVSRGITTRWRCCGHVNLAKPSLTQAMADAGCRSIFFGIESGSNAVLKRIKKGFSIEKAFAVVEKTLSHMEVSTNFMWGFPGETAQELDKTLFAARYVEQMGASSSLVMLAPLSQAPMSAGAHPIRFDPTVPNIFCEDYRELVDRYRPEWFDLIASSPLVYCAFYHFESSHIASSSEAISFYAQLKDAFGILSQPSPLWQKV